MHKGTEHLTPPILNEERISRWNSGLFDVETFGYVHSVEGCLKDNRVGAKRIKTQPIASVHFWE